MLNNDDIEHFGDKTRKEYSAVEIALLVLVGSYLLDTPYGPLVGILQGSTPILQQARSIIDRALPGIRSAVKSDTRPLATSLTDDMASLSPDGLLDAGIMQRAVERASQTASRILTHMDGINLGMSRGARELYVSAAGKAVAEVISGGKVWESAQRDAVAAMAREGITAVQYRRADGTLVNTKTDVAVRRAVATEMAQDYNEARLEEAEKAGENLVEVSITMNARESHAVWQGQVYQLHGSDKYPNYHDSCHVGDPVNGIGGYNCGHVISVWREGTPRHYSDPLEGTGYTNEQARELVAKQRALERDVRALKRERDVLGELGLDNASAKAALRSKETQLDRLVNSHSILHKDKTRLNVYSTTFKQQGATHLQPVSELARARAGEQIAARDRIVEQGYVISDHVANLRVPERKVSYTAIEDALNNPLDTTQVKYNERGEPSYKRIGQRATVAINPETNKLTTVHPTSKDKRKKYADKIQQ
jgi:hypothetical protein